jgi:hypothetical protein
MKMVINASYGGFGLGVAEQHEDWVRDLESDRFNAELVEFVETHPDECGDLAVVIIPDEATDWEMDEYDGWESVIYVLNGKIIHAECEGD